MVTHISLVLTWFEELKAEVPGGQAKRAARQRRLLVRSIQLGVRYRSGERVMTWTDHIQADPQVLGGKPVIKGTRLAVEFVLGLLADGWTREQLRANYPQLTDEALRAAFAYAAEALHDQTLLTVRPGAA
jgi:uncharacterized protein (DUF433 family)